MNKRSLYILLLAGSILGYGWVIFCMATNYENLHKAHNICIFKAATGLPCPSCGATRCLVEILKGNLDTAMHWNPLGFIILAIMIVMPLWIISDLLKKRDSFYRFYLKSEQTLRRRMVYMPAAALIIANWIWSIQKGL